jgi:hypothetical protein
MAGTLTISTLSDGTNSTSATNCIQGSAKAWVNFTGSSGSVNASYNVSSVTRSSTGLYVVNFTNAFTDANYGVTFGVCGGTSSFGTNAAFVGSVIAVSQYGAPNNKTTTACQIGTNDYTATARDFGQVYVAFNR